MPKPIYRGVVYRIGDVQTSNSGYQWRELVLTDGSQTFPQYVPFSFSGDALSAPDGVAVGQLVDVEYTLRGHLTETGRAFASLRGLSARPAQLTLPDTAKGTPAAAPPPGETPPTPPTPPAVTVDTGSTVQPWDAARAANYKLGDLCSRDGKIYRLEADETGAHAWKLVPTPTPAGTVVEDLPF